MSTYTIDGYTVAARTLAQAKYAVAALKRRDNPKLRRRKAFTLHGRTLYDYHV